MEVFMNHGKRWIGTTAVMLAMCATMAYGADAPAPVGGSAAVVAKVNGEPLTKAQVDAALRAAGLADSDATRAALTNDLIAGEVVRQAAEKSSYGDRPEVKQAIEQARARAVSQLYLREHEHPVAVTDAQVKARYDAIVANLGDKEYKPRIISVGNEATARTVLARIRQGKDFAGVAREFSTASNKASGGEVGWVSLKTPVKDGQTQGLPLPLAEAIVKLSAGGVAPAPIQIGDSWVIVKLDSVRPTQVPAFDTVKGQIRQQLDAEESRRAMLAVVDPLLKDAKIER